MDSIHQKLDLDMQILLAHALRSEAGIIRQHYPSASPVFKQDGQELLKLNDKFHLLRTGVGLDRCESGLQKTLESISYDLIIHFGVSGSLLESLPTLSLTVAHQFKHPDKPDLSSNKAALAMDLDIPTIPYFSSPTPIVDETSREMAISSGAGAVDMESYSAAHFCISNGFSLLAIRCISDRAGITTPDEFKKNYALAAKVLQEFILTKILVHFK